MADREIRHRDDCRGAVLHPMRGARGDNLVRCRTCGRFALAEPEAVTPERTDPPVVVVVAPVDVPLLAWFCREHCNPVSWRGTGCAQCDTERDERRARQRKARAARRVREEVLASVR